MSSAVYDVAVTRAAPVLGFLAAVTVLAELAQVAGVFDVAAHFCARAARGSTPRLYLLLALLGTATTVLLSLDTTAVLLTPVVLAVAARVGVRPLPFALLAVWLANVASLLLPVSNLTNLLALDRLHLHGGSFAARMWLPALVAIVVAVAYLAVVFRRDLRGRYSLDPPADVEDRWLFGVGVVACVALAPGVLLGAPPWAVATPCAVVLVVAFLVRRRDVLRLSLVPWRLLVGVELLFVAVTLAGEHGLDRLMRHLEGTHDLQTAAVAAGASNAVNNLPAYLALERGVPGGHPTQVLALLLGTNIGPLITLWGSLATLLWRQRCRSAGVDVSAKTFALVGLGGMPLVLVASWLALRA
ncbi:MAG TPA: SLC13 family permease [Mycobacteriales bacterium]|nr:SLC13 family permease [Mycobacteriales bacterium]